VGLRESGHPKGDGRSESKAADRNASQPPAQEPNDSDAVASQETFLSGDDASGATVSMPSEWLEPDLESIGPYRLDSEVGRGGMGIVFRAIDTRLERPVALKLLRARIAEDPSWRGQLETEAKLLASINHPNIATLHSLESSGRFRFLTMELVDGESLQQRLRSGPLPLDEALADARQIASALEAAHQRSIVHCDLKPANVMRRSDGVIKVLDFGLARRPESHTPGGDTISGTPGFMSPEQIRLRAIDARSDLFSFGSLVFECLTGSPAFPGATPQERIEATLRGSPALDALPNPTPPAVRTLLERCLAMEPDARPESAAEVRPILESALESRALAARQTLADAPGPLPRPWTSFVGRSELSAHAAQCVMDHPLVTLTGFGGCGKTRLALQVAEDVADRFRDGVSWIDLASMKDPSLFWHSVARSLALRDGLQ
jgi:serine/threonine protein kinase